MVGRGKNKQCLYKNLTLLSLFLPQLLRGDILETVSILRTQPRHIIT